MNWPTKEIPYFAYIRSSLWYWQLCWERFPPNRWLLRRYKSPIFPLLHRSPSYDIKTSWNRDIFLHEKLVFASGKTLTFPKGKKTAFRYFSVEVSCGGHTAIGCAGCPYPLSQVFLIFLKKQKAQFRPFVISKIALVLVHTCNARRTEKGCVMATVSGEMVSVCSDELFLSPLK